MSTGGDHLDPDRLESAEFPLVRRGFEPELVRTQLAIAAAEIRRLRNIVVEVEGELSALEARSPADLAADKITEAIGEEAVRVLDAARNAASERAERAEAEAGAVVASAQQAAADLRSEAEARRDVILAQAGIHADGLVEQGRIRGRDMVAEAQTVRERMLRDLAQKRQQHRAEVEQLRAGRDRLLESLAGSQQCLDDAIADLVNAVPEAQAAAERAGLRVSGEPALTVEQLEAEISTARLIDHPLIEGVTDPGERDTEEQAAPPFDIEIEVAAAVEVEVDQAVELAEVEVEAVDDEVVEVEVEDEAAHDSEAPAEVDDLFARLRSARLQAVAEAEDVLAEKPEVAPVGDLDDLVCADAVDEISRSLKRLVVDEQGDLLDGLRREGADTLRAALDDDSASAYVGVLAEPLGALVIALVGDGVEVSTRAAEASVQALLVEPIRARLRAALEETDDPDELTTTVRAVYREGRTRRTGEAAAAAVAAVLEAVVGMRASAAG